MERICADLEAEHDALDAVVADITEDQWNTDTPAEGWDVKDTIVHLIHADVAARIAVTEPDRFLELKTGLLTSGFESVFGSKDGKTGTEILAWWRDERSQMLTAFAARGPKDRIPWFGPDMSALSFATARLMETWSHGQDVADTIGVAWPPTDRLRHVAHIGVSTRGWSYVNRGLDAPDGPVHVALTSPSGETWHWGADDATDRISGPAEEFCLVVTQRRRPEETSLVAEGPLAEEWIEIAQAFAGPPTITPADRVVETAAES
ncbi:MAG: TIGR03084 family metal-binding protein [Actinomycetota bacterium]